MPSIPLPFLVAVLLLVLLAAIARGDDDRPANRPFIALIAACALQSVLLGLRWGYGLEGVRYLLPIVATTLPPLVYASFAALAQDRADRKPAWTRLHALPPVLVAALVVAWPPGVDVAIIAVYLGYAAALLRIANLNLNRLARKAGIPARRISIAVNRLRAKNVSQYINEFRIAEACRLLVETGEPVTRIMFEAGFQTKSNFNREFRRVTGMSPMAWRTSKAPAG